MHSVLSYLLCVFCLIFGILLGYFYRKFDEDKSADGRLIIAEDSEDHQQYIYLSMDRNPLDLDRDYVMLKIEQANPRK